MNFEKNNIMFCVLYKELMYLNLDGDEDDILKFDNINFLDEELCELDDDKSKDVLIL